METILMVRLAIRGIRVVTLVLAAYWLLLFIGTHIPRGQMPAIHHSDKTLHFLAYAGLAFLLAWAFPKEAKRPLAHVVGAWIVATFYGAADEITQLAVGRSADFWDWVADTLGAMAGLVFYVGLRPFWARVRRSPWLQKARGNESTPENFDPKRLSPSVASVAKSQAAQ
ncbi:MAG: VanZ family protein [Pirellulales bacterium]